MHEAAITTTGLRRYDTSRFGAPTPALWIDMNPCNRLNMIGFAGLTTSVMLLKFNKIDEADSDLSVNIPTSRSIDHR